MIRNIFIAVVFLLIYPCAPGFAQSWRWAQRHGGDSIETAGGWGFINRLQGWNSVVDIATDAQNNSYVVSLVLSKYLDLNGQPLSGWGKSDILLSSYTCEGVLRWSKVIGSNQDSDAVIGVRCDDQGVCVGGLTTSNFATGSTGCHFSTDTVTGNTTRNIFLAKWDFNGNFLWLRMPQPVNISADSARASLLLDMDATPTGDTFFLFCYLRPGSYGGGAYPVTTSGIYVLKYTSSGAFAGGVALPYHQNPLYTLSLSRCIFNKPLNQFIIAGNSSNNLNIGGTQFGYGWGYLASFDARTGNLNYLIHDTMFNQIELGRKVTTDLAGNIYLSGSSFKDASFNGVSFPNSWADSPAYVTISGYAPFVMKLNGRTGAPLWTTRSLAITAYGMNVCLRKRELLLTGSFSRRLSFAPYTVGNIPVTDTNEAFLAYLDTATGAPLGLSIIKTVGKNLDAWHNPIFNIVIADRKGSFLCGGGFNDTLVLGSTTLIERHPAIGLPGRVKAYDAWVGKLGYDNCNCTISASYVHVANYGLTSFITYTGSTNLDSLVWDWGDGTHSTYTSKFANTISHVYPANGLYQVCVSAYNDSCLDSKYCGMLPLGVSKYAVADVQVYPNPASDELYITHLAGGSLRLITLSGQTLLDAVIRSDKQAISVGKLPAGYYLLMLRDENGQPIQRGFVKQ
ncbi:MAG: T9SS type A sorting domain-containing protein [Bacteroidetes bacterium]|nr:T9SS type A sorting domain-containing protein [Bacteroidota bacterium]MBS1629942.1 T9SS type A sorting domain-containing protein [Bacteroidota bacterium]